MLYTNYFKAKLKITSSIIFPAKELGSQSRQLSGLSHSNDDLDRILGNPSSAFLDKNIGTANSVPMFDPSSQGTQLEGLPPWPWSSIIK